ncbi:MAG: hypothetical protein R2769_17570 [Saprospiraceae bacterium]
MLAACNTQESYHRRIQFWKFPSFGQFTIEDAEFYTLIDSNAAIEIIDSGYNWLEGPLWLEKGAEIDSLDVPRIPFLNGQNPEE